MALWLTTGEANDYFATRSGAADYWGDSYIDPTAELTTAQNDLVRSGLFTFSNADGDDLTEDPTQAMKDAVCEQALFRLQDQGVDRRAGLQVQGVIEAGTIKEKYSGAAGIPISPQASSLLADLQTGSSGFSQFPVTR